jgi:hypothetical protein
MFFLKAECLFCSLDALYGGLGISKLQFLITRDLKKIFSRIFFHQFVIIKPWIRIGSGSRFTLNAGS